MKGFASGRVRAAFATDYKVRVSLILPLFNIALLLMPVGICCSFCFKTTDVICLPLYPFCLFVFDDVASCNVTCSLIVLDHRRITQKVPALFKQLLLNAILYLFLYFYFKR